MYLKKLDITKRCLATENKGKIINLNLVTTHLFSMHADDDEQHFN